MPRALALMTSPTRRRPPIPPDQNCDYEVGYRKPPRQTSSPKVPIASNSATERTTESRKSSTVMGDSTPFQGGALIRGFIAQQFSSSRSAVAPGRRSSRLP
jgi:hypothetical protein